MTSEQQLHHHNHSALNEVFSELVNGGEVLVVVLCVLRMLGIDDTRPALDALRAVSHAPWSMLPFNNSQSPLFPRGPCLAALHPGISDHLSRVSPAGAALSGLGEGRGHTWGRLSICLCQSCEKH